jgi:hypothetical protein
MGWRHSRNVATTPIIGASAVRSVHADAREADAAHPEVMDDASIAAVQMHAALQLRRVQDEV